jgi:hypothetical protein
VGFTNIGIFSTFTAMRKMKRYFYTFLPLLLLPALARGQQDSVKLPNMAVNAGLLMGGGAGLGADVEYLFAENRWGVQAGAGITGFGAGLSYHLKPRINSPFASLQYCHQVGANREATDILGAMYVYRYKKWLQAGAGLGTFLSESEGQKPGEALLMLQVGIFAPFSLRHIAKSTLALTQRQEEKKVHTGPRQAVYLELFGRAPGLYSVNYDCRFRRGRGGPGASVGFGYIDIFGVRAWAAPVSVYYLFGSGVHHVELGAGATAVGSNGARFVGTATAGYRYQPASGLALRAGLTPLYGAYNAKATISLLNGGVSVGYAF